MTTFEKLSMVASGTGEVWDMARTMIGVSELALLLAQEAVKHTTAEELSPAKVMKATGLSESGARAKIFNTSIQEKERSKIPCLR
jgi:hypothetical protein